MKILTYLTCLLFLIISCGKSPLQLEKKNIETSIITGLEAGRIFKTTGQNVVINWTTPINSNEEAKALLIVKKDNYASDLPKNFTAFLWMPEMGHGSSPITIKKLATGIYQLSDIYFIMDGLWQLRIQIKQDSEVLDEQLFEYKI